MIDIPEFDPALLKPYFQAATDVWITPALKRALKSVQLGAQASTALQSAAFRDYLRRTYERLSLITTLVFPNKPHPLRELYVPLTLTSTSERIVVDRYPDTLFRLADRVLIVDSAGMGKSTLLKYPFLVTVLEEKAFPVFLSLRQLRAGRTIATTIADEVAAVAGSPPSVELITRLLASGGFLFLLDGYDEVPLESRDDVLTQVDELVTKADKNKYIVTSRPDVALIGLPGFHRYSIQPLREQEAFALLRKYGQGSTVADQLVRLLRDNPPHSVRECLSNPLLVSLLYKAFEYEQRIPLKPHVYYRQVYDALFEAHDLSKGGAFQRPKFSGLDREDFHLILRRVGFESTREAAVEYDRDKAVALFTRARKAASWLQFSVDQFTRDLLETVPLFQQDGTYLRWVHKSFQDYFAAQFVCVDTKGSQELCLLELSNENRYQRYEHVLRMCYEIDYKSFRRSVVRDIAENCLRALATERVSFPRTLPPNLIERRVEASFGFRYVLVPASMFAGTHSRHSSLERDCAALLGGFRYLTSTTVKYADFGHGIIVYSNRDGEVLQLLSYHDDPMWLSQPADETELLGTARATIYELLRRAGSTPVVVDQHMDASWQSENVFRLVNALVTEFGTVNTTQARELLSDVASERRDDDLNALLL